MIETAASKSFTATRVLSLRNRMSPLVWLNLLCLDAPAVAVSWQWLFARTFGVPVPAATTTALFLTAWVIYLADRFGDAASLPDGTVVSLRQEFCLRYRRPWLAGLVLIGFADLIVISWLDRFVISAGAGIGALALVYLRVNRIRPALWRVLPLKEVSIGFIFAAGTMVGLFHGLTGQAWPAWFFFASLCSLNCISIAVWEQPIDLAQQRISIATVFPCVARGLGVVIGVFVFASLTLAFSLASGRRVFLAVALSAALLGLVHVLRRRIASDTRTALADLVLLTPIIR